MSETFININIDKYIYVKNYATDILRFPPTPTL